MKSKISLCFILIIICNSCITKGIDDEPPHENTNLDSNSEALTLYPQATIHSTKINITELQTNDLFYNLTNFNGNNYEIDQKRISFDDNYVLIAAGQVIKFSEDYGRSWSYITTRDIIGYNISTSSMIDFTQALVYNGIIILGAKYSQGIFISYDKGKTWSQYTTGTQYQTDSQDNHVKSYRLLPFESVASHYSGFFIDSNTLYICFYRMGFLEVDLEKKTFYWDRGNSTPRKIFVSNGLIAKEQGRDTTIKYPNQNKWIDLETFSNNLFSSIWDLSLDDETLLVTAPNGVFLSKDMGTNWKIITPIENVHFKIISNNSDRIELYGKRSPNKGDIILPWLIEEENGFNASFYSNSSFCISDNEGVVWKVIKGNSLENAIQVSEEYYSKLPIYNGKSIAISKNTIRTTSVRTEELSSKNIDNTNIIPINPELIQLKGHHFVFQKPYENSDNSILYWYNSMEEKQKLHRPLNIELFPLVGNVLDVMNSDYKGNIPKYFSNQVFIYGKYIIVNGFDHILFKEEGSLDWNRIETMSYHYLLPLEKKLILLGRLYTSDFHKDNLSQDVESYSVDLSEKKLIPYTKFRESDLSPYNLIAGDASLGVICPMNWLNPNKSSPLVIIRNNSIVSGDFIDIKLEDTNLNNILEDSKKKQITKLTVLNEKIFLSYYLEHNNPQERKVGLVFSEDYGVTWNKIIESKPYRTSNELLFTIDKNNDSIIIYQPSLSNEFKIYASNDHGLNLYSFSLSVDNAIRNKPIISIELADYGEESFLWVSFDDRIIKYKINYIEIFQDSNLS